MPKLRQPEPFLWPSEGMREFCRRWKIAELSLFGSVLRDDFRPDSDIDLLVRFAPDAAWSLLDHAHMERELEQLLGRRVDLVSRAAIEKSPNWIRRKEILETSRPIYAA
jgi:predicted nucleotidyltransferase